MASCSPFSGLGFIELRVTKIIFKGLKSKKSALLLPDPSNFKPPYEEYPGVAGVLAGVLARVLAICANTLI